MDLSVLSQSTQNSHNDPGLYVTHYLKAVRIGASGTPNLIPPTLLAVTVLTSISTRSLAFELKVPLEMLDYVQQMALMAQDSGIGGCVCSPLEIEGIRQVCDDLILVCPGVRPTWAAKGDQQRVMTPGDAIKAGANYLVIGRPITQADDPASAFGRICEEIAAV